MPAIGLSFLDVLCCGLGSAVFLLLVIQHGPSPLWSSDVDLVASQILSAQSQLAAAEQRIGELERALALNADETRRRMSSLDALANLQNIRRDQVRDAVSALRGEQQRLDAEKEKLRTLLRAQQKQEPEIEQEHPDQLHLTGLEVRDDQVAIFLDTSASMLDESLVQIIRLRASSNAQKAVAPKWVRARKAAAWVHERLPRDKRFRLFTYSDTVRDLNGAEISGTSLAWQEKKSGQAKTIGDFLEKVIPGGATNLRRVFQVSAMLRPPPRQIVLITDGLPTLPGNVRLGGLKNCRNPRRGAVPLITAACRRSIFENARALAGVRLRTAQIDVILLPLEGDSDAVGAYWSLTQRGGRLLTPAADWPYR